MPEGATHSCPSYHAIAGRPVCPCTGLSSHASAPFLHTIIQKIPCLPHCSLHGVLCSPGCCPSSSVFSLPPPCLIPRRRNLLLPNPDLTTTARFLFPRPGLRQNLFYSIPQLCPWRRLPSPGLTRRAWGKNQ